MSLNLVAKVRKPTRLLTRDYAAQLDAMRRNVRGRTYTDTYFDPYAGAVILTPQVDPGYWVYGKDGYSLYTWNGSSWTSDANAWVEGENAFGDEGGYVGFAGNTTYPATTPWACYRAAGLSVAADAPLAFTLNWTPPTGTFLPKVEFWPRVDTTRTITSGGYTYYYAPVGFYLDSTNADLVVCEYEFNDLTSVTAANVLNETYRHPLNIGVMGLTFGWVSFTLIPVPSRYDKITSVGPPEVTEERYYDDFVLKSPVLKDGGFCYRSKVERTATTSGGCRLFPEGLAGIRSLTGGLAAMTIPYVCFPSSGSVISQTFWKRQEDTTYPTVTAEYYLPSGTSIAHTIVDSDGNAISSGATFQSYRVKSTLTASADGYKSPILYSVTAQVEGAASDSAQDEIDISSDVNVTESVSEDLIGYRVTVNLRNLDGEYDELVARPANEVSLSFAGTNRSIVYTQNPSYPWYKTPTDAALWIDWECGDFWTRLKNQKVCNMPDYGGRTISYAITDFLKRLGFDDTLVHIDATLNTVDAILPWSSGKDEPISKPQDGTTADEFLSDIYEKWFGDYAMYFGADSVLGVLKPALYVTAPPDLTDPTSIHRIYYNSRALADAAGETDPYYVCGSPQVSVQHDQFYNEIVVFGVNPATKEPIVDMWVDIYSQTDENYVWYVGERRRTVAFTRLPTQSYVSAYLDMLRVLLGRPRRHVTFTTKYDPTMRAGKDFIRFHGINAIFKVLSTSTNIDPSTVSQAYDDTVHGCNVEAIEWPTT